MGAKKLAIRESIKAILYKNPFLKDTEAPNKSMISNLSWY